MSSTTDDTVERGRKPKTTPISRLHDPSPASCRVNLLGATTHFTQEDILDGPSCGDTMRPEGGSRSGGNSSRVWGCYECWLFLFIVSFADYASRSTARRSVSGGVVMCAGAPVWWHSKTQKCMTLSTTECVAMSDMGKDIIFLRQVWCFMLPKGKMPCIVMYEDNEGAIKIPTHPTSNSNS